MIDSPFYLAANEVLQYLSTLKDETQTPLFKSAEFGIMLPKDRPNEDNVPALRVWVSRPGYPVKTEQLYTGEREGIISIGIYLWLPNKILSQGTDGTIASDGVTFTSKTGDFFGFDGCQIAISDTTLNYMAVVDSHTVTLSTPMAPGTGLGWWFQQGPQNPARQMLNYSDYVARALTHKDVSGTGFEWSADYWAPNSEQTIRPDLFSQLRQYNGDIPIQPPWYSVEIPLGALLWDLPA